MKGLVHTALVAALLCAPMVARADDDAEVTAMAKEHYKLGLDAYKAGHYPEAIKELKKAYLLKRLPALLLNIAATYRKMGDADSAISYYKKYLAEAPEARDRRDVEKTIAEIEKEKTSGGAAAGEPTPPAAAEPAAPAEAPAAASTDWKLTPVDAAPPNQPLDVRVTMPVTKGVKVYVYYRIAGEADFNQVLMKRHGSEKIGRIPATAMNGKSVQFYVEGKDDKGTVVKSFGSAADPNVVMIDAGAAPQMVAGGEASGGGAAAAGAGGAAARAELDDEAAPITGEIEERPGKKHRATSTSGESRPTRFGKAFYAGAAFAAVGVVGVAVGAWGLYQAKSYADVLTADSNYRDPQTGQPYHFTDPAAQPYDDKTVEQRGKFYNTLGIAMTTVGGIALAGGAALMIVDQTILKKGDATERPKRTSAWLAPAVGPAMAGVAGGATF